MNDFSEVMRKRSNAELIIITTLQRSDYLPEALNAAYEELTTRDLTPDEFDNAMNDVDSWKEQAEARNPILSAIEAKSADIIDAVNPMTPKSEATTIKVVTAILLIYYIYNLIDYIEYFRFALSGFEGFIEMIFPIIQVILLPIGIYGFWKVKNYGWIILTGIVIFDIGQTAAMFASLFMSDGFGIDYGSPFDSFGGTFGLASLARLLIWGGFLFYLFKDSIARLFNISNEQKIKTIGVSVTVLAFFMGVFRLF